MTTYPPSQPPVAVDIDLLREKIPLAMQKAPRWLLWRNTPGTAFGSKPRKVPVYACGKARTGKLDTPRDIGLLVTLDKAIAALANLPGYGIGFALGPSEEPGMFWQGNDFDDFERHPEHKALISVAPGYKEWSPSGNGAHIIGIGAHFEALGSNRSGIEAYSTGRYFTVTGQAIGGELADISSFVRDVLTPRHGSKAPARQTGSPPAPPAAISSRPESASVKQAEDLRSALQAIDPDDYGTWIAMGLALKPLDNVGFELWDAWSQASAKYQPEEMLRRWVSFTPDRTGPAAVFAEAQRRGWINPAAKATRAPTQGVRQEQVSNDTCLISAASPPSQGGRHGGDDPKSLEKAKPPFEPFESFRLKGSDPSSHPSGETVLPFVEEPKDIAGEPERGFLLKEGENGKGGTAIIRLVESIAAEVIAARVRGRLALDRESDTWLLFDGTHWAPLPTPARAEKILADLVALGCGDLGYRDAYLNGIIAILRKRDLLALPPSPPRTVPFKNGLLSLDDGTLTPARPDHAHTWVIPHQYDPAARCREFLAWLERSLDGDLDTLEVLRAWMSAGIQGIFLQVVMILHGLAGTGKSALARVLATLLGDANVAHTSMRLLEQNRFEVARLYGKRLVQIAEAGKYGGDINTLKMLSGGDAVPIERKHQQQTGSFRFAGLILVITNDLLMTTDSTSGIERRRVQVSFNRSVSQEERQAWRDRGGEEAILHTEAAGIINWLLELRKEDIHARIESLSRRVVADNLTAAMANNAVVDWLVNRARPVEWSGSLSDPNHVQVGSGGTKIEGGMKVYTDDPESRAFPSYLRFCDETRRNPTSLARFVTSVIEHAERLGHKVKHGKHSTGRYGALFGLQLVREWEHPHDWTQSANAPRDF